jgi:hypothetical protein
LEGTGVTDAKVSDLQQLPKLRFLNLVGTLVTAKSVKSFMGAMPGLSILHPSIING